MANTSIGLVVRFARLGDGSQQMRAKARPSVRHSLNWKLVSRTNDNHAQYRLMAFDDVPEKVRRRMSRIRKTGSKPEVLVRRLAHGLGYRFRINRRDMPGTPD